MKQHEDFWTDKFGYKCCIPPPGIVISLPWAVSTSASANNLRKLKKDPDESSKFSVGIWYNRHIGFYEARLRVKGKRIHIGSYKTIKQATEARKELLEHLEEE